MTETTQHCEMTSRGCERKWTADLRTLALLFLLCITTAELKAEDGGAIEVTASLRRLNVEDWTQNTVGDLIWRGGLELTSTAPNFGGFSGLLVSPQGDRLTAVSDQGRWLTARLVNSAEGQLSGLEDATMGRLKGADGTPLDGKSRQDAESLARLPDGSLLLSFERDHRIWRYGPGAEPLAGVPQPLPTPDAMGLLSGNHGIEALVTLDTGQLLAIAEGRLTQERYPAFLWGEGNWQKLSFNGVDGHRPAGATRLPNGDLLLVERRFTTLGGLSLRLGIIPAATVRPGARLESREIARLLPPLTIDNFEGIAAWRGPKGKTLIALLSDDNFSPLQRTLLLLFELRE
jgi:hypothetical protein